MGSWKTDEIGKYKDNIRVYIQGMFEIAKNDIINIKNGKIWYWNVHIWGEVVQSTSTHDEDKGLYIWVWMYCCRKWFEKETEKGR